MVDEAEFERTLFSIHRNGDSASHTAFEIAQGGKAARVFLGLNFLAYFCARKKSLSRASNHGTSRTINGSMMAKRPAEEVDNGNQAFLKRQKTSNPRKANVPVEEIRSGRQLQQILAFDQDASHSKHAIQSFKALLDRFSIEESDNAGRIRILKEYLESQKSSDEDDKTAVYLTDIMQTWSFASQSNEESLLSAVPAVLALLLRTLSNSLELSEYGLRLGRTLLQKRQQELIARGVTANKSKEFVISPALRLLRELTAFDGGTLAKQVFRARDYTFKNLARNLNLRFTGDAVEDRRKPSVRTNSIRFVLACIKFLPADAKRELLNQRDIVGGLTRDIKDDPPFVVREILEALKLYVLQDEALPRDSKTKVVNSTSLGRIAMLYRYNQADDEVPSTRKSVDAMAHEFLLVACTSHDLGVLNHQAGYYPRGIDPDDTNEINAEHDYINLGLDSIEWIAKFTEKVPVRNTILSDFIQNLRPWSSPKQSELLLAILRSAPELIADYFFGKKLFLFDAKLTATWIGYSAFLFCALQLPLPAFFGHETKYARLPPPTSIVLESLLPQPLNQKVLTRCLNQSHNLITLFAVRLLCVSLSKLQVVLQMYREASFGPSTVWAEAAERLKDEYCQRCPSVKDIIGAFRNIPITNVLQREATAKLLVLCYEVIPRVALDAKFDVSGTLAQALKIMDEDQTPEDRAMRVMELENLFQFAKFSPGMRWFSKADGLTASPFVAMLKLSAKAPANVPPLKQLYALESIVKENQILQTTTSISALDSFIWGLREIQETGIDGAIYEFIGDCVSRVASNSVKYLFTLEKIQFEAHGSDNEESPVSLLTLAILEQWPFIVKSVSSAELRAIAGFIARYLTVSTKINEDKKVLKIITQRLADETPKDSPARKIIEESQNLVDTISVPLPRSSNTARLEKVVNSAVPSKFENDKILATMLETSTPVEDHNSLVKWVTKEVEEVIEEGYIAELIMLLSSEHLSVRKEAATNISKFAAKLKNSSFEEKEQIWLLLSEVVETARKTIDQERLPTIISSFASSSIFILNDPLHCLYSKINKFLSQGPTWELDKIPLMYKIMDDAPSLDDAHYLEIAWLLNYMLAGLRTPADMAIYRKRRVFEKFLSLYNNPYLATGLRDKILRILFKATTIEGGSTTLITRFSTMTWLQAQVALGGGVSLKVLMERMLESCDHGRVNKWSKGGARDAKVDTLSM